ncbi:hypothetical protein HMPREF9440_02413 [Sutterella parvirubra YIT 11816]|uniref:Uncharacterized protein n=1 Tax=Sutterella parvirubra YIT 11816 TaxID=762967 RepID=H3KI11_9BURK|nr:hypothetical protein HMPREF9440_02413 [Sutterella parvirubra YIT 11816]
MICIKITSGRSSAFQRRITRRSAVFRIPIGRSTRGPGQDGRASSRVKNFRNAGENGFSACWIPVVSDNLRLSGFTL